MADDRDAPRPAQQPLPRQSAHVGHVCVVDREAEDPAGKSGSIRERKKRRSLETVTRQAAPVLPLDLSAPEYVLLLVHVDGEVLVLALLDGIGPGGDGPHLLELAADGYVSKSCRSERQNATCATTLAVLPCSKHSCRSSLSVFVVLKGLRRRNNINECLRRVQTEKSLFFKLKTGLITSPKGLIHTKHVLIGSQMLQANNTIM